LMGDIHTSSYAGCWTSPKIIRFTTSWSNANGPRSTFAITNPLWSSLRKAHPNALRVERNLETGDGTFYVANMTPIDPQLSAVAGDALQNLRSALDHLAWKLVEAGGGVLGKHTSFPIFDTETEYLDPKYGAARKIRGMHEMAAEAINQMKPYATGNRTLWILHRLNNIDKHRLLLTAGHTNVAFLIRRGDQSISAGLPSKDGRILKVGDELFTVAGSELDQDIQFVIDVALDEPEICKPIPLIFVLRMAHNEVVRVITDLARFL